MPRRIDLIVIDPQNDFCIKNGFYKDMPTGALLVNGAHDDMLRLAKFVEKAAPILNDIHVTLDSHHKLDVAHPLFWRNAKGENPNPFTAISAADVRNRVWYPSVSGQKVYDRMLNYVDTLEKSGRYPLMVWTEHCLIGTPGAAIVPELMESMSKWVKLHKATIDFVTKGSNPWTEHYSAVKAEVPDPADPSTQLNAALINTLEQADEVLWAGEAADYCVYNTIRDTFDAFGPDSIKKSILLTDATSAIDPSQWKGKLKELTDKGMRVSTLKDYSA